jgi:hypothetical protein
LAQIGGPIHSHIASENNPDLTNVFCTVLRCYNGSDYAAYGQISSGGSLSNRNNYTMQKDNRRARSLQAGHFLPIIGGIKSRKSSSHGRHDQTAAIEQDNWPN